MADTTTMNTVDAMDHGMDPNASPLDSHTTPGTEFSPPSSPYQSVIKDTRLAAKVKLAKLTQKEKVSETLFFLGWLSSNATLAVTDSL